MLNPDTAEAVDLMASITPGTYPAEIKVVTPKLSKKGGSMIVVETVVSVNGQEKKRTAYVMVSGKGAYGFDQLLRACHFTEAADKIKDKAVPASEKSFDEQSLVGQRVNVVIDNELDQNQQTRDVIKSWLAA